MSYWLYGAAAGVVLVVLQWVEYRRRVRDLGLELFGLVVGVVFLALGLWWGRSRATTPRPAPTQPLPAPNPLAVAAERGISPRELEVLALMVEGLSNQEIADRLFVSLNTVKTHISNLYQKLAVQRRAQAIRQATDLGLVLSGDSAKSPERVKE